MAWNLPGHMARSMHVSDKCSVRRAFPAYVQAQYSNRSPLQRLQDGPGVHPHASSERCLVHYVQSSTPVQFDVTSTLARYESRSGAWRGALEAFISELDGRVTLGPHDRYYEPIVRGVEAIVTRLCEQLALADQRFAQVRLLVLHVLCYSFINELALNQTIIYPDLLSRTKMNL